MAGRRTNLALLALLPLAGVTGLVTYLVGSGPIRLVVVIHGVVGFALLVRGPSTPMKRTGVLSPWKSAIARRGLRRRPSGTGTSLVLAVALLVALVTGLLHSTGVLVRAAGLTALQVHVGAVVVALVPALLHVRRRRMRPRGRDLSRRSALRAAGLVGAASGLYALAEGAMRLLDLPGARRRATGSYEVSSGDPDGLPNTAWLFDEVPATDLAAWRLTVRAAGKERRWTLPEIRRGTDTVSAVLDCTGGWWSRQQWTGTLVTRLLPEGARGTVEVISATGYRRRLPVTDDLLLAVDVGGRPLSDGHGAPARLVVPGRRGYHWVKWVVRIEHDDRPWWVESPLPLQ